MSSYAERPNQTRDFIREGREAVLGISEEEREAAAEDFERLLRVLDFADHVLSRTVGELVPDDPWNNLDAELQAIASEARDNPSVAVQQSRLHASNVSNYLNSFPASEERWSEQASSEVVSEVRRVADQELAAIKAEIEATEAKEAELRGQLETRSQELQEAIEARKTELDAEIEAVKTSVAEERQRLEQTTTEQAEVFRAAQEDRSNKFNETSEAFQAQLDDIQTKADEKVQALVEEIEGMRDRSGDLVGSIGVTGTAERYKDEADEQKKTANTWRWFAVAIAVTAAVVGLWATRSAAEGQPVHLIGKLAIGVALGLLATYAAKQSSRHRDREEEAKSIQLDLAAFPAFIEPLDEAKQNEARMELGDRLFGRRIGRGDKGADEVGPGLMGHVKSLTGSQQQGIDPDA